MTEDRYIIEVKRLRSQMVAVAMRYLENNDDAEDITQDALLKLWAMREMLRESEVDRLAFTVLKHLCINELKKREYKKSNNEVSIDSVDVALDSDNPQEIEERERQLMVAVDKLPSKQRLLLQMRYLKGKDVRTIAQITGGTEDSVNKTLSRARNKIYKFMAAVVAVVVCVGLFTFITNRPDTGPAIAKQPSKTEDTHKETPDLPDSVKNIEAPMPQHELAQAEQTRQPRQMAQIKPQEQPDVIHPKVNRTSAENTDARNNNLANNTYNESEEFVDTYSDPQIAQAEAEKALQMLADNLDKGLTFLEAKRF